MENSGKGQRLELCNNHIPIHAGVYLCSSLGVLCTVYHSTCVIWMEIDGGCARIEVGSCVLSVILSGQADAMEPVTAHSAPLCANDEE